MRVLPDYIFLHTILLLFLLISILFGNIYLNVSKRQNLLIKSVAVTSFFGGGYVMCLFIQTVILELPFEVYFQWSGRFFGVLTGMNLLGTLIVFVYTNKKNLLNLYMTTDYASIFNGTTDMIIIYDHQGSLLEINRAAESMRKTFETWSYPIKPLDATELQVASKWYCVQSSPIVTPRGTFLGDVVVLHPIEMEKKLTDALANENGELENANSKLIAYLGVAEALESEKIRLTLVQEVQMILVMEIEKVIHQINALMTEHESSLENHCAGIASIANQLRQVLKLIRHSVQNMTRENPFKGVTRP